MAKVKLPGFNWRGILKHGVINVKYIYLAGPIFTSADQRWMSVLKERLQEALAASGQPVRIIWPFEETPKLGARADNLSAKIEIFDVCVAGLRKSDLIVAILDGSQVDDGTAWEIGYFHSNNNGTRNIFGLRTDVRNAGDLVGGRVNSLIEASCSSISTTESDLIVAITQSLKQESV